MIIFASDHAGLTLKNELMAHMNERGIAYEDVGTYTTDSCDYPDYAVAACRAVTEGRAEKAVLVCGTGLGMSMCANKIPGIRAALCSDCFSAEMTRQHNDANVICFGGRVIGSELAKRMLDLFLDTPFSQGANHVRRLEKIAALEK